MDHLGTVVSTMDGPSPSRVDFVVNNGKAHKGMFIELTYSEGTMMCMIDELIKTNRYFERPDSVKAIGDELEKNFPAAEWEFLLAKAKPLGVFSDKLIQRSTFPPSPGTKVYVAQDENIKKFLKLEDNGLNLGKIQFHDVELKSNLSKLLQKHLAVLAMSGAGKCVKPDTEVRLANGENVEIQSIVNNALNNENVLIGGVEISTQNNDGLCVFGIDSNNQIVKSKIKAFMRRRAPTEVLKITTWTGQEIEVTNEHPIPIIDEGIKWVAAEQLRIGDYSFVPRIVSDSKEIELNLLNYFDKVYLDSKSTFKIDKRKNTKSIPSKIKFDADFARFLAYLLAEGHNAGSYLTFSNDNSNVFNDFIRLSYELFSEKPYKNKHKNEVRIFNKGLCIALSKIGFTSSSWTKFIPQELLQCSKNIQLAFLSAFIDCDGEFSDKDLEITLASKNLIKSINHLFLQNNVVPRIRTKKIDEKIYKRLFVSGAKNMKILSDNLSLKIDYKHNQLKNLGRKKYNTNVDVLPNCSKTLTEIRQLLNIPIADVSNYIYDQKNPSIEQVNKILDLAEERFYAIQLSVANTKELFYSLPNIFEEEAREIVCNAYAKYDFNEMSFGTGISSTTARRIVRGITNPKFSSYVLAQNCLSLQNKHDVGIDIIINLNFSELSLELNQLCKGLGFEIKTILSNVGFNKGLIYSWTDKINIQNYSNFYMCAQEIFKQALLFEQKLPKIEEHINLLRSLTSSGIFFDKIISIERQTPDYEYVYDLSTEHSSFIANNLLIHNSYFQAVLLEELCMRSKEQGQIATLVFDTHGEYTSFGEPADKEFVDFSSSTKVIDATKIKISVSNMTQSMLSSIIPSITPVQKRELFRIISKLREEMKSGVGPFDLNSIKAELPSLDSKTAIPLQAAIDELERLRLFSKIDEPSPLDLVKPGQLTIINLNNIISEKKKQLIVYYFSQKLFNARRVKKVCPFAVVVEEAHNFIPETTAAEHALAKPILRTIAREGRKFGVSLVIVSQRPKRLDTTTLANCNTNIILRITNPYDLDHIKQSSEGLDSNSINMISSLRVGEALIVGEAVSAPTFFKVRLRKSMPSKHENTLEEAAKMFYALDKKQEEEIDTFL